MSKATMSSACRTGHHRDCSGRRRGKKRKLPCSCPCHNNGGGRIKTSCIKEDQSEPAGPSPVVHDAEGRPSCFGNCYELSSACNACPEYNRCRKAS